MGASIHINGTGSSVIDTVFVCRSSGTIRARDFEMAPKALERLLRKDVAKLEQAGHTASPGDATCMLLGHLTRLAVWQLRPTWQASGEIEEKLKQVQRAMNQVHSLDLLPKLVSRTLAVPLELPLLAHAGVAEERETYDVQRIPF
jgi:hypothetical protein